MNRIQPHISRLTPNPTPISDNKRKSLHGAYRGLVRGVKGVCCG